MNDRLAPRSSSVPRSSSEQRDRGIPRTPEEPRHRLIVCAVALIAGLLSAIVTPPGHVPDEIGHFLRGVSIGEGDFFPHMGPSAPGHHFPAGIQTFVQRVAKDTTAVYTIAEMRTAAAEPLRRDVRAGMEFPAWYTPVPYAASAAVAFAGVQLNARPFWIFYAGRIANLLVGIAIIAMAMRAIPRRAAIPAAVLLLPMTVYELASWSADGITIAAAILMASLIVRNMESVEVASRRELLALCAAALLAGLCKPAYFLLVLPAVLIPASRFGHPRRRILGVTAIVGAMAIGTLLSFMAARSQHYHPKRGQPVDPQQQLQCVRADPVRFAGVALRDMKDNGVFYLEETISRLGTMNVKLPKPLIVGEWLLLLFVAIAAGTRLTLAQRLAAIAVCAATVAGISLSQYLVWSVICGDVIEGIQGRYYLPLLPFLLFALNATKRERAPSLLLIAMAGVVANGIAIVILAQRFWV